MLSSRKSPNIAIARCDRVKYAKPALMQTCDWSPRVETGGLVSLSATPLRYLSGGHLRAMSHTSRSREITTPSYQKGRQRTLQQAWQSKYFLLCMRATASTVDKDYSSIFGLELIATHKACSLLGPCIIPTFNIKSPSVASRLSLVGETPQQWFPQGSRRLHPLEPMTS
jgi:hypothetical protein